MLLAALSAGVHYFVLQRIKAGSKQTWQIGGLIALGLGLAAVALQVYQLANLPFPPGSSGYSSVFVGFYAVFLVVQLSVSPVAGDAARQVQVYPGPVVRRAAPHVH